MTRKEGLNTEYNCKVVRSMRSVINAGIVSPDVV
jgi:hypothetical protein